MSIASGRLKVLQPQCDQLVPVAAFEQNGRTVAADSLHKAGVAVVDRGGIRHGGGGAGEDRSGCMRHGSFADGFGAIIGRVRGGWHGGEQQLAQRRQDRGGQGLQGELRVNPASDFPERFTAPGPRWLRGRKGEPMEINSRKAGNCLAESLFGCGLKELTTAVPLRLWWGKSCWCRRMNGPNLQRRISPARFAGAGSTSLGRGPAVGTVSDLISGGNDLLEITTSEGRKLLIPFVEAIVPDVQLEEGWLLLTHHRACWSSDRSLSGHRQNNLGRAILRHRFQDLMASTADSCDPLRRHRHTALAAVAGQLLSTGR